MHSLFLMCKHDYVRVHVLVNYETNKVVKRQKYDMPFLDNLIADLGFAKIFAKVMFTRGGYFFNYQLCVVGRVNEHYPFLKYSS